MGEGVGSRLHTGRVFDFSLRPQELAPLLVGALLSEGGVTVQLTEVEAYAGRDDPSAHAWGGPRPHTRDLFGEPGTLYCYLSHGLHVCGNVVCEVAGGGSAVLFRAGRVLAGLELARARRGSVAEVALIFAIPENTVKTRLFYARKKLATLVRSAGVDRDWL